MCKFIQKNSPDGGFLQSDIWKKFQRSVGGDVYSIKENGFWANIIIHKLPLVGKYFYVPRGPVFKEKGEVKKSLKKMIDLAKKNKIGWIRVEPTSKKKLNIIKKTIENSIVKAPHNMQPEQIFVLDLSETKENLLKNMKSKTRYNIKLAERKGVICEVYEKNDRNFEKNLDGFLNLSQKTANRKKIRFHKKEYFRKMLKNIPDKNIKLYVARYKGEMVVANIVVIFGKTITYLHGASSDKYRNVMAPFLLQWKIILDAKKKGMVVYDLGGVKTEKDGENIIISESKQSGISRFKLGFSPGQNPIEFPGSYDIIINKSKYLIYRFLQKIFFTINNFKK